MNCKKCDRLQAEVDELWPFRKRAEKAEQERDEARKGAHVAFARCRELEEARREAVDELYRLRATADPTRKEA